MFWPVFGHKYYFDPELGSRGIKFWLSIPFQVIVAILIFPVALFLSIFDIKEEANNHLVIARKKTI